MGALSFFPVGKKQRMKTRMDATPLRPEELALFRKLIHSPVIEEDLDAREVAKLVGLTPRTILNMVRDTDEFPGAWKPAHNRVLIPKVDVAAFKQRRRVRQQSAEDASDE